MLHSFPKKKVSPILITSIVKRRRERAPRNKRTATTLPTRISHRAFNITDLKAIVYIIRFKNNMKMNTLKSLD